MNDLDQTRARILGDLIRGARLRAGRSTAECAAVLGISDDLFSQAEAGEYNPSLPDLEVLAMYLEVPMAYFWGSVQIETAERPNYQNFNQIRQRIIGALLRQARIQSGSSLEEAAEHLTLSTDLIEAFESGESAVPLFDLERLGRHYDVSMDYFSDANRGPLAQHEARQKMIRQFNELPADIREFVSEPVNLAYLETAERLSNLDVRRLRSIAEGILDITL